MQICVSVEGPDGAGKSVVIDELLDFAYELGIPAIRIDKRSSPLMCGLSDLIALSGVAEDGLKEFWLKDANVYARMARDLLKAEWALNDQAYIVVLDRFILSTVAHAMTMESSADLAREVKEFAHRVHRMFDGRHTIFLCCVPFDICWTRIKNRGQPLSKKELRGPAFMEHHYEMTYKAVGAVDAGSVVRVNTGRTLGQTRMEVRAATQMLISTMLKDGKDRRTS